MADARTYQTDIDKDGASSVKPSPVRQGDWPSPETFSTLSNALVAKAPQGSCSVEKLDEDGANGANQRVGSYQAHQKPPAIQFCR